MKAKNTVQQHRPYPFSEELVRKIWQQIIFQRTRNGVADGATVCSQVGLLVKQSGMVAVAFVVAWRSRFLTRFFCSLSLMLVQVVVDFRFGLVVLLSLWCLYSSYRLHDHRALLFGLAVQLCRKSCCVGKAAFLRCSLWQLAGCLAVND